MQNSALTEKKLITASEDHTAKIWNIETGKLLFDLKDIH
jgi:WD40 repeat protein